MKRNYIEKEIIKLIKSLKSHWEMLQQKYDIDVKFMILRTGDFLAVCQKYSSHTTIDEFVRDLYNRQCFDPAMDTHYVIKNDIENENITRVSQIVIMEYATLLEMVIENITKLNELNEFLIQTLTHEMGHVLCNMELYDGIPVEEINARFSDNKKHQDDAMVKIENLKKSGNRFEYYLEYNRTPSELMANNRVGLTPEKLLEAIKKLYD